MNESRSHLRRARRILIRGTNWIGDAVMSEPALSAIRAAFPNADITLLVKPAIAELFQQHPGIDHIFVYEHRGRHARLRGKWSLIRDMKRGQFDAAILFQNAFEAALLTFLAGIPYRYGYATDGRGILLSEGIAVPERTSLEHHTQYYLNLLRPLGIFVSSTAPRLYVNEQEERSMRQRLAEMGIQAIDHVIGLNPGSTYGHAKRWLPERFAETADRLADDTGARVVIVGASGEEALGEAIAGAMRHRSVVLSGRTSIRELMAIMKRCRLLVTNDTGPMHIASAFGVPIVAVFGPTDSRTTAPFGPDHTIVRQAVECSPCMLRECPIDHRCMTRVTVDYVYQAASRQLKGTSRQSAIGTPLSEVNTQHSTLSTQHLPLAGVTVFLDRDGTVNLDTGYIKSPEELVLLPGVVEAVARLNRAGARVVLVTNQSAIARGFMSTDQLKTIHAVLMARLEVGGARFDALYYCPHHPDDGCACRKPRPAMVHRAVADLGLDLSRAYVVGDQPRDIELAWEVGARSVLVLSGQTRHDAVEALERNGTAPHYIVEGLPEAVAWIVKDATTHQSVRTIADVER